MSDLLDRLASLPAEKRERLLRRLAEEKEKGKAAGAPEIPPRPHPDAPAPLSFAQERLWFLEQLNAGESVYNNLIAVRLTGALDRAALEHALEQVVRRHEVLRTTFQELDGEPRQVVAPAVKLAMEECRLEGDPAQRERRLQERMRAELRRPFDLRRGPLWRTTLVTLSEREAALLITLHHITSDGWSMGVLVRELGAAYAAFQRGQPAPLSPLPIQYADFAQWQRSWPAGKLERELDYWRGQLDGAPPLLDLPTDRPRPPRQTHRGDLHVLELDRPLASALDRLSREAGTTLYMTLLAGFASVLHRWSLQDEVVVGAPIANRNHLEVEGLVGFFVNTLPLRVDFAGGPTFRELLGRVRQVAQSAYEHQDAPYERIVEALQPERSLGHSPLFQVMFALQNAPVPPLELEGLRIRPIDFDGGICRFDVVLAFEQTAEGTLRGRLEYSADLFDRGTMEGLGEQMRVLLQAAAREPDRKVAALPLVEPARRAELVELLNRDVARPYPRDATIGELFERQVARSPGAVALEHGDVQVSYAGLNRRANQLAHLLRSRGVRPGVVVGLCLRRSADLVVGILGILKAGGAYLPLDPSLPTERLELMLDDAGVTLLLSVERHADALPSGGRLLVLLDEDQARLAAQPEQDLPATAGATDLAYVMFTSGSTGTPKGVCIPHRGVVRLVMGSDYADFSSREVFLQLSASAFDASTFELWGSLLHGARLVIPPEGTPSLEELGALLVRSGVTTLFLTTALFEQMALRQPEALGQVRQVLAGGEVMPPDAVRARLGAGKRFIHCYGPTESTTFATCYPMTDPAQVGATVPIGRPIANTRAYVLDGRMEPVPPGLTGELYLGGDGLATGYLHRPDLTAEKFVPDPFSSEPGARLYRTGDMVRLLPGGLLDFAGRRDSQVKVRGFRIELGEIEVVLSRHPEVAECVVVARGEAAEKKLVAYVVGRDGPPGADSLRAFLGERLPEYMVPAAFVTLQGLPLNRHGKVDRRALPDPAQAQEDAGGPYTPPSTPLQQQLAALWSEVLEVDRVGEDSNFFKLGGHSLLATQLVSRIRETLHVELPMKVIFEAQTLAKLAEAIERQQPEAEEARAALGAAPRPERIPLSFAQQRLWFLDRLEPGSCAYHLPVAVRVRGPLQVPALQRALEEMVRRHEALRTTFTAASGEGAQVVSGPRPLPLEVRDARAPEDLQALLEEQAERPFDLEKGPLLRGAVARLSQEEHVLVLVMHHIISDGWSLRVLVEELGPLYRAALEGRAPELPPPLQYPDFALWQRATISGPALERQLSFWKAQLAGAPAALELPADRPRPAAPSYRGRVLAAALPPALAGELKALAGREGASLFMVLLAGFEALLQRFSGQDDFVVGSQIANRHRAELEGIVGFFVNTLALRADLGGDPTFRELLQRVREGALGAYAHQDLPFERLVQELNVPRDLSRHPLFQVSFVLQNAAPRLAPTCGLELSPLPIPARHAKFDLELVAEETPSGVELGFEYSTDLFDERTIARLARGYRALLEQAARHPARRLSALEVLVEEDRARLLGEWARGPAEDLPRRERDVFHRVFEAQARRTPDAVAATHGARSLTYAELNARANRLAHWLRDQGAGEEQVVGLALDRGLDFLTAMLGVFKAGAAYLPLDMELPPARLSGMVQQARCRVLLSEGPRFALAAELAGPAGARAFRVSEVLAASARTADPEGPASPRHLAYVFFTSGSTGAPKGAGVVHAGMLNHLDAKVRDLGLTAADVVVQNASQSFDISVWQFLVALALGGRTVVVDPEVSADPLRLLQVVEAERATVLEIVPSLLHGLLDALGGRRPALSSLRWLVVTGEELKPRLCRAWLERYPNIPIVNAYGPTECSDDVTHHFVRAPPPPDAARMPIGRPLINTALYVLDRHLRPVPPGTPGELFAGGAGVGRGYLHDPARTASAFLPDPFSAEKGARLYRTGDLVRHLADGSIEFLGRIDHQVKVRGYRIELGEIEAALAAVPGVKRAVVEAREDRPGAKRLVAYLVAEPDLRPRPAELRAALLERLPDYMVPAAFVALDAFPLLTSGKVDRRALPAPSEADAAVAGKGEGEGREAPESRLESLLAELWAELLHVERVGVHDGFFDLGGHSLVAIQLVARLRAALGVELPLRAVFERPTVAELARYIESSLAVGLDATARAAGDGVAGLRRLPPRDSYPLAGVQLPEWYFHELEPENPFYNVTLHAVLEGALDVEAMLASFRALVARHAALRLTFGYQRGEPVQRVSERAFKAAEQYRDLRDAPPEEVEARMRAVISELTSTVFDFARGPLYRFQICELPDRRFLLAFVVHHIVWDETSTINMAGELSELYNARRQGRPPRLPELAVDYPDWIQAADHALKTGALERHRRYWLERFRRLPPPLQLPTDRPRPALQTFRGDTVQGALPPEVKGPLEAFLRQNGVTLYIYLLAVMNLQLHRLTGQDDLVVGTPIVNRDDEALEPVLGLFASAMPMRLELRRGMTFLELLRQAREAALEAYEHHAYPSALAIQELAPEMDPSRTRLFSVMYGTQNNKTRLLATLRFDGAELSFLEGSRNAEDDTARFDLTVIVDQTGDEVSVRFNYNTDLFDRATAERMHAQFLWLVRQTLAAPALALGRYRMLGEEQERAELDASGGQALPVEVEAAHGAFQRRAAEDPGAPALVGPGRSLGYGELDAIASRWARALAERGIGPEQRVALFFHPSESMVAAMLAVLEAGAAYVPIHPDDPPARQRRILEASGARVLLAGGGAHPAVEGWPGVVLDAEALAPRDERAALPLASGRSLAYVLCTSGTTGAPKAIEIEHRGVANIVASTQRQYRLGPADAVLFLTPYSFDAAVLELYWPLSHGAKVVVAPPDAKDPQAFAALADRHQVTVAQCVPFVLEAWVGAVERGLIRRPSSLRLVICGGAFLSRGLKERFERAFGGCALANHYGPTEVTVDASSFDCRHPVAPEIVPIGAPVANARVYVLDQDLHPVPRGTVGELYVSSPGVARGYAGEPAATAARFLPDPWAKEPGARMYRTGDLGRRDAGGQLHFAGRADKQVKHRGNRIELEEIEAALSRHPGVAACAVHQRRTRDGVDALLAFVEPRPPLSFEVGGARYRVATVAERPELRSDLEIVHLDAWPEYFAGDCTLRAYWPRLWSEFPRWQWGLLDASGAAAVVGNAIPIRWDGTVEGLPAGWDGALEQGFGDKEAGRAPNALVILAGAVSRVAAGRGLSDVTIQAFKALAEAEGLQRILAPVRPTGKANHPELSFEAWCERRRSDGLAEDPWLRAHQRAGGKLLKYEPRSQRIVAGLHLWQLWAGRAFEATGEHVVPGALAPVRIDLERQEGEYFDPSAWMEHRPEGAGGWRAADAEALREHLRGSFPEHLLPDQFRLLERLPVTSSGKPDEQALRAIPLSEPQARERVQPSGPVEEGLAQIWREVLGLEEVGVNEDFFELGGHSLHALRVLSRIEDAFGVKVSLKELYRERRIDGLVPLLRQRRAAG